MRSAWNIRGCLVEVRKSREVANAVQILEFWADGQVGQEITLPCHYVREVATALVAYAEDAQRTQEVTE